MRMLLVVVILLAMATAFYWLEKQQEQEVEGELTSLVADADSALPEDPPVSALITQQAGTANKERLSDIDYVLSGDTLNLFDQLISESESKETQELLDALYRFLNTAGYTESSITIVQDVFSRYIEYKKALEDVKDQKHESLFSAEHLQDTLFALNILRNDYFSDEEIRVLFGEQNEYDQMALERLRIYQDKDLTEAQKQRLLEENIAQLPEETRKAFQPSIDIRKVQQIKAESDELTREQRLARLSAEFGEEAGQRLLAAMDKQQDWNNRIQNIQQDIQSIQQNSELTDEQKYEQIESLKKAGFTEQELRRLDVYLRNPELLEPGK